MEKIGSGRKSFSFIRRPPRLYSTARGGSTEVEVFEPYDENLPLEAGYYTFVLDENGKFRIKRGNFSSHATFVKGAAIGAAGQFRINRAGNVAEIFCRSVDYWLNNFHKETPSIDYVISSFSNHHALELSPLAIFHFKSGRFDTFQLSINKEPIPNLDERLSILDSEGQGTVVVATYSISQRRAFLKYKPEAPQRLYGIHRDQMTVDLESADSQSIESGKSKDPLSIDQPGLTSGKKAFVIDEDGWLIVGFGHHILSGGNPVGSAGQFSVDSNGEISEINLNFSGHYRPPLDADYARYTFRVLINHPLLKISQNCKVTGRKFDESSLRSTSLLFSKPELLSSDSLLEESINFADF
jgi:hypothetical protein